MFEFFHQKPESRSGSGFTKDPGSETLLFPIAAAVEEEKRSYMCRSCIIPWLYQSPSPYSYFSKGSSLATVHRYLFSSGSPPRLHSPWLTTFWMNTKQHIKIHIHLFDLQKNICCPFFEQHFSLFLAKQFPFAAFVYTKILTEMILITMKQKSYQENSQRGHKLVEVLRPRQGLFSTCANI